MSRLTVKWKDKLYDLFDPVDIADNEYSKINFEKAPSNAKLIKSRLSGKLKPAEIIILTLEP